MNVNRFRNQENIVYADIDKFVDNFEKETGIENLKKQLEDFKANPVPEGKLLKGKKRTSIKLLIPNLTFNEPIEMGENVWVYMGENYEIYCIYEKESWKDKNFSFFSNVKCEYFPCHRTGRPEDFNCLFCYCPLYALGETCGGNFTYTDNGIKDCSDCMVPHTRESYGYINERFSKIAALAAKK